MEFAVWESAYEAILADFGYGRGADERARDLLGDLLEPPVGVAPALDGATVAVAGGADCLTETDDLALAREADVVFAASNAAERLRAHGVPVDCMVTDLDKSPATARDLTAEGTPVAVHAHGDNLEQLHTVVPELRPGAVIPTTQARPAGVVRNYGGFTDGDRAAFLAEAMGADRLCFPGWAFDDPTVGAEKKRKLDWAERLLYWLEQRRDERFGVLDGRRSDIPGPDWTG
jgi:uncharacterized Rossmann fold enzyme